MSYIAVIGAGDGGTTLACILSERGYDSFLYGYTRNLLPKRDKEHKDKQYLPA